MELADVIVIGAGPAGLSAALGILRFQKKVIVFDSQNPRNSQVLAMQNVLGFDGVPPAYFKEEALRSVRAYPGFQIHNEEVVRAKKQQGYIEVETKSRKVYRARKILLAHGLKDELPDVESIEVAWGKSVFHCPFCHGYEYKNQRIAILGPPAYAMHVSALMKNLCDDIVVLSNQSFEFSSDELQRLRKNKVGFISKKLLAVDLDGFQMKALRFEGGEILSRDALLVMPKSSNRSDLGLQLGLELDENQRYLLKGKSLSTVDGVYVAGDVTEFSKHNVVLASASGSVAAAEILHAFCEEDF